MCAAANPSTSSGAGGQDPDQPGRHLRSIRLQFNSSSDTDQDESLPNAPKTITEADIKRFQAKNRRGHRMQFAYTGSSKCSHSEVNKEKSRYVNFVHGQNQPNPYEELLHYNLRCKRIKWAFKRGKKIFYMCSWYTHQGDTELDHTIAHTFFKRHIQKYYESQIPQEPCPEKDTSDSE